MQAISLLGAATLTTWEAYTTCINMYVGMSLLSMGYSLMIGGYMQVISLLGVMLIGNYTGLLMVACFEKFPNPEISYEKLGGYAMSKISPKLKTLGIYMVAVSVTVEFIGVASIAYVFLFRHAYMLFNQWFEFRDVVIVCTTISFPTVFALNFSEMTIWSLVGTIAPICAVLACIGIFLVHNDRLNDHEYTAFNFEGTGISAGTFLSWSVPFSSPCFSSTPPSPFPVSSLSAMTPTSLLPKTTPSGPEAWPLQVLLSS